MLYILIVCLILYIAFFFIKVPPCQEPKFNKGAVVSTYIRNQKTIGLIDHVAIKNDQYVYNIKIAVNEWYWEVPESVVVSDFTFHGYTKTS